MIDIRRKTIGMFVVFLMLAMLATPLAMAKPAEKTTFIACQMPTSTQPTQPPEFEHWVTDGDTAHIRNMLGTGRIWWGTTIPSGTPSGSTSSVIMGNTNLKTGQGIIKFEMTWTIGKGSYEGNLIVMAIGAPFTENLLAKDLYIHGVMHGEGAFAGQTLLVDGTKLIGQPFEWTGTMIMP